MKTTLNKIKKFDPCASGWAKLLKGLGKTEADDEPLSIAQIIETNDFDDAMWATQAVEGHDRELRLFACWCCDQIAHLITDERSKTSVIVARKFANGQATEEERAAARAAAWDAAWAAARDAARDAARAAARAAAMASARDAAWDAARDAARAAAWDAARDAARAAARAAAMASARDAARASARAAARAAMRTLQKTELIRVCDCIDRGEDPHPQ